MPDINTVNISADIDSGISTACWPGRGVLSREKLLLLLAVVVLVVVMLL